MKSYKYSLIVFLIFIGGFQTAVAQWSSSYFPDFYYPSWTNPNYYNRKEIGIKENNIHSQIIIKEGYKKGKPVRETIDQIKTFDKSGNEVAFTNSRSNGKIINRTTSRFDTANNHIQQLSFNRKKLVSDDRASYDHFNHCTGFTHYNSKGKLTRKMEHDWDSTNQLEARSYKNGTDLTYKWVFEFYPDKTSRKATKYNANGKVKKVWTYDCSLLGEKVQKHEDTVKMCHFDSTDSQGYYYKIYKESRENGKLYKTIYKYSKDSLFVGYKYYDEKNRIISMYDVSYSGDTSISTYKSYNKRGKIRVHTFYKLNKKQNVYYYSESCWKDKKCAKKKYISVYLYDKKGILMKITTYYGSDIHSVWNYFYTFY
jgi:hypothetical protein